MAVIVRHAHEDDVQVLSRLIGELQGLHAEAIPSRFKQPNDNTFPPSKVLDRLSRPQATFLICDVDSAPAGYIYLDVIDEPENDGSFRVHTLYVQHIYVGLEFRRSGGGTALISAARDVAKARDIDRIALDVWSFNSQARSFFQRQGFVVYREILAQENLSSL